LLIIEKDGSALYIELKNVMKELGTWFHKSNAEKTVAISFHTIQNRHPVRPQTNFKCMNIVYKSELRFFRHLCNRNLKLNSPVPLLNP
jgi:hypothetical protein